MNYSKFILISLLLVSLSYSKDRPSGINYLDPVPGADLVRPENNIIIGFDNQIRLNERDISDCISITGSKSDQHAGTVILCYDRKKIIFKPAAPFMIGETVSIKITGQLMNYIASGQKEYTYLFNTISKKFQMDANSVRMQDQRNPNYDPVTSQKFLNRNSLLDLPHLTVNVDNHPSTGYIFMAPYYTATYLTMLDTIGNPYWYSQIGFGGDFKTQPNGNLTYYDGNKYKHYEMDGNYNIIDSFYCGNGYTTDIHELRVLSNNHALVLAYDPEIVNMSHIIQGGDTAAEVVGLIIQEIDQSKNVVFQWRSWDHFAITDALHENLLAHNIDAVHGNAIEMDNDGNLLISSRHLDEITKINRTTGDIIWRFGGLHNQFTFLGDTLKFTYQHAIRRIANGDITLYDNGNFHHPPYSRAVEYNLNEVSKTATLVWKFRHNPDVFGSWGGYVQRLDGGNTLIGWGGTNPAVTEVQPDGTITFEASYPPTVFSYRAYKFNWNTPITSINNQNGSIPKTFNLAQNYPNPFNPGTIFEFELPKAGNVTLKIYDVTGRESAGIINNLHLGAGVYKYSFDGSYLSSGVYFYRLTVDGAVIGSKKMVLIK
jgi:hypothetical protein